METWASHHNLHVSRQELRVSEDRPSPEPWTVPPHFSLSQQSRWSRCFPYRSQDLCRSRVVLLYTFESFSTVDHRSWQGSASHLVTSEGFLLWNSPG